MTAATARSRAGELWRGARTAAGGSAVVLTYHRVATPAGDANALAIPPSAFDEQMRVLAGSFHPLAASDLARRVKLRRRIPPRSVVVTFDDGYADLLTAAKPALERHGVPACAFVSTAEIGTGAEKWWDEVEYLRGQGCHADSVALAHLEDLDRHARDEALGVLAEQCGAERPRREEYRTLSADELRELSSAGSIEIGAHTISHRKLATAPAEEQRDEIAGSKAMLEEIVGRPVTLFSYPFGQRDSFTAETRAIAARSGFTCAFANWFGLAFPWSDRWALPRCPTEALSAEEFEARLEHWFALGR